MGRVYSRTKLSPEAWERRRARQKQYVRENYHGVLSHEISRWLVEGRVDPVVIAARKREIPEHDARTLTGRVFGDPNPADQRRVWR